MKSLIILLTFLFSFPAFAREFNHRPITNQVKSDMRSGDKMRLANRTDYALNSLVRLALWKLRHEGFNYEATKYEFEWETKHMGSMSRYMEAYLEGRLGEIGDYNPLSQWIADFYKGLEKLLGKQVLELLHLDDINILNFTIPIVFHIEKVLGPISIDLAEYAKHWTPFWGVVAYWSVWAGCEAATWGSGWFIICTPAGMAAESLTVKFIAPPFADNGYDLFWG